MWSIISTVYLFLLGDEWILSIFGGFSLYVSSYRDIEEWDYVFIGHKLSAWLLNVLVFLHYVDAGIGCDWLRLKDSEDFWKCGLDILKYILFGVFGHCRHNKNLHLIFLYVGVSVDFFETSATF